MIIINILIFIMLILLVFVMKMYIFNHSICQKNISILHKPSKVLFEKTINVGNPVLIKEYMNDWGDFLNWTPKKLKKMYPNATIRVSQGISEQMGTNMRLMRISDAVKSMKMIKNKNTNSKTLNCKEYDQEFYYCNEDGYLLEQINKRKDFDIVTKKLDLSNYILKSYAIWMGLKGSKTGIHYDKDYRNYLCQIYGKKKIYLWSPNDTKYMYKSDKYEKCAGLSKINLWDKNNVANYPLFNKAKYIEVILNPGEIIYIPSYWWHAVENITDNLAISVRYENITSCFEKALIDMPLFLLHNIGLYKKNNCMCHNK